MKILNLAELSRSTSSLRARKGLSEIVAEVEQGRSALNPFTIAAKKIIRRLNEQIIFPFLQPTVVNPLEEQADASYYRGEAFGRKFPNISGEESMGMNMPYGLVLCKNEFSDPHFINESELSQQKGNIDYHVYDLTSLQGFISRLIPDMSFLHPMNKSGILNQHGVHIQYRPKVGDIVLIPGQRYGKLGIVAEVVRKEYLALLTSEDDFHNKHIGVNTTEMSHDVDELEEVCRHSAYQGSADMRQLDIVDAERLLEPGRLPKGISAILMGKSNYEKKNSRRHRDDDSDQRDLGFATIAGYDADCAVVLPYTFDSNERLPWGAFTNLAIPADELVYLGSAKNAAESSGIHGFFLDNMESARSVNSVMQEILGDKMLDSLTSFSSLRRYSRLLDELRSNANIPPNLVSSQFISILTAARLDGLENLARIAGDDPVDVALGLLAEDCRKFEYTVQRGSEKYGHALPEIAEIVLRTTKFKTVEELLVATSDKIGLYSMPRDGKSTLALLDHFQVLSSKRSDTAQGRRIRGEIDEDEELRELIQEVTAHGERNKSNEPVQKYFADSHKLLDVTEHERFMQHYWRMHEYAAGDDRIFRMKDVPDGKSRINDVFESYCLTGIFVSIPLKELPVRYGRNRIFEMEYPQLSPLEASLALEPFASSTQLDFMDRIAERIRLFADFEGKDRFIADYQSWRKDFGKKRSKSSQSGESDEEDEYRSYMFEERVNSPEWLMGEIRPLYEAIKQLTRSRELRDQIVGRLFDGKPTLREAYFDYEYMQLTIGIRDHFWRGHLAEKNIFMRSHGYVEKLADSGFADEWYHALSSMDLFHRAFPRSEERMHHITRNKSSGFRSFSDETRPSLGYSASPQAEKLLAGISARVQQIGSGNENLPNLLMIEDKHR